MFLIKSSSLLSNGEGIMVCLLFAADGLVYLHQTIKNNKWRVFYNGYNLYRVR